MVVVAVVAIIYAMLAIKLCSPWYRIVSHEICLRMCNAGHVHSNSESILSLGTLFSSFTHLAAILCSCLLSSLYIFR